MICFLLLLFCRPAEDRFTRRGVLLSFRVARDAHDASAPIRVSLVPRMIALLAAFDAPELLEDRRSCISGRSERRRCGGGSGGGGRKKRGRVSNDGLLMLLLLLLLLLLLSSSVCSFAQAGALACAVEL